MENGSNIVNMEHEVGFCSHEGWCFGTVRWDTERPMPFVVCTYCDFLICALPDYYEFTSY